jgi:hypothetical protein
MRRQAEARAMEAMQKCGRTVVPNRTDALGISCNPPVPLSSRMIFKAVLLLMKPPGADNNAVIPIASRFQTWYPVASIFDCAQYCCTKTAMHDDKDATKYGRLI